MLDFGKLFDIADELRVPGLVERGAKIARDAADWAASVVTTAGRAGRD